MTLDTDLDTPDLTIGGIDAARLATLAESDAAHDRDGTYAADCIECLRDAGWLAMAVPTELGGEGATIRVMAERLRALARHAPNTALVTSMHTHVTLTTAWRFRRGLQPSEALLRRIAEENIFVTSTGGNDFLAPSGQAKAVDGGFVVSARKQFCSGALSAAMYNTGATLADSPEPEAIHFGVAASADGVSIEETWDALGMRGTGSHDVVFDEVFVPEAAVAARRPLGVIAPLLQAVSVHAFPVVMAVYLGVAEAARDRAIEILKKRGLSPSAQRLLGLADQNLATADWALRGILDDIGDDPTPTEALFVTAMLGKKTIAESARTAVDVLMDAVGGAAYSRRLPIERAWRDLRAAPFHPLSGEQTLLSAGALATGQPLL